MATLSVVYKIAADISGLQAGIDRAAVATEKLQSTADSLKQELTEAFTVGALVAFGREVLDAGDKIQKMADQTSMSTDEVQKLMYIAGQSGSSIESLVGSVQKLQMRLGDENTGAAGAMAKLGIEMESFSKLGAYEQMTTLSNAIVGIKDPTEVATVGAKLFGKAWGEILPAMKSGMKETGDQASIMSEQTVKSLDRIGDTMTAARQMAIAWGGTFVTLVEKSGYAFGQFLSIFNPEHLGQTTDQVLYLQASLNDRTGLAGALAKIPKPAKDVAAGLGSVALSAAAATEVGKQLTRQGEESIKMHEAAAKAAEKNAAAIQKFKDSVDGLSFKTFIEDTSKLNAIIPDLTSHVEAMAAKFAEARDQMDDLTSTDISFNSAVLETEAGVRKTVTAFSTLPNVVAQGTKQIHDSAEQTKDDYGGVYDALGDVNKILSNIPGKFAEIGAVAARTGEAIMKNLADGNIWGAIVAGVTGVVTVFAKLFTNAEKQVNPVRQAFVDLNGGLAALNEKAHAAGMTLDAMLNARTPEAYKKAIDDLNAAFEFQDQAMKTLDDTVAKYGFTIDQLGPTFAAQKLSEQAGVLLQDYQVLTAAGVDHVAILDKMAPAMQNYVNQSLVAGAAIPETMRPVLQAMVDAGLLTDSAGEKMTDLAGLTFTETLDKKFTTLIDTINKLADAISRGVGGAIASIPTDRTIHIGYEYDPYQPPDRQENFAATGGLVTATGIQHFAAGGNVLPFTPMGTDTVPAMLTPGEVVLNKDQQRSVFGGRGGSTVNFSEMRAELAAAKASTQRLERYMTSKFSQDVARAVRDEVGKVRNGGRR